MNNLELELDNYTPDKHNTTQKHDDIMGSKNGDARNMRESNEEVVVSVATTNRKPREWSDEATQPRNDNADLIKVLQKVDSDSSILKMTMNTPVSKDVNDCDEIMVQLNQNNPESELRSKSIFC